MGQRKNPVKLTPEQQKRFDVFWKAYPHKRDPGDAREAFAVWNPDDAMIEVWLKAIAREIEHKKALKKAGKFCPEWKIPGRWIRAESWGAEYDDDPTDSEQKFSFD